jgi:hypothetical protein
MKTLHGNIVIKEDIPLSPDDHVSIRIENVSLMDVAAILISEQDLVSDTASSPFRSTMMRPGLERKCLIQYVSSFAIRKESYCGSQTLILQCLLVEVPASDHVDVNVERVAK